MHPDQIRIGPRHRKRMGDIDKLAASIAEVGLLHPVVVKPDGELIAGARRLAAIRKLGWDDVSVTVVDLDDVMRGEYAENVIRKDFTPTEAVAIGRAIEERVKTPVGRPPENGANCAHLERGRTTAKVGEYVGMGERTYEKAKQVVDAAEEQPDMFGDLPEKMDDKSVDAAYKELKKREREIDRTEMAAQAKSIPSDDRWHIEVADIRDYHLKEPVDFIITDPPYPKKYLPLYGVLAERALDWLKPEGLLLAMCGGSYLDQIMPLMGRHLQYYWTGCYLTPGAAPRLRHKQVNCNWKPIVIYTRPGTSYKGKVFSDVWTSGENSKEHHDWGQSVSGMLSIIEQICLPGQTVFDPFVGGNSTGVAALMHGCLFYGIDSDPVAVGIAKQRLHDYAQQKGS
ncbi:ParB N-terminal domain-containing protein [Patescibacteria group bacterium]|nr:ParB N-terminal domain-containing protein [Patescibacteria group bacterium]